ncbi:MAG: OmpA family protein [Bacteroidota bacterium]
MTRLTYAVLLIASMLAVPQLQAQTDMSKWSIGLFPGIVQYHNSNGSEFFKMKKSSIAGDIGVGYRLNPSFLIEGHFMGANLDFDPADADDGVGFDNDVFDLNAQLVYRFDNGYILNENARIAPFLAAGIGGIYSNGGSGAVIPFGGGINVRYDDLFSVQLRSQYNLATPSEYNFVQTSLGFVWHMGGNGETAEEEGPMDSDGDGIVDDFDKCPDTPGLEENNGCPGVDEETKEVLNAALEGIQFETSKDVLKKESYPILDRVVALMKKHPEYNLSIEGHTDSSGDDAMNLDLSKRRAKSALEYLVENGIERGRLQSDGYGETRPVADNGTAAGRAKNRRVEFKVKYRGLPRSTQITMFLFTGSKGHLAISVYWLSKSLKKHNPNHRRCQDHRNHHRHRNLHQDLPYYPPTVVVSMPTS